MKVQADGGSLTELTERLTPTADQWRRLAREDQAMHLMARPLMSASVYVVVYAGPVRPVQLGHWAPLVKAALVVSELLLSLDAGRQHRPPAVVAHLLYAAAAARLLLGLFSKRPQVRHWSEPSFPFSFNASDFNLSGKRSDPSKSCSVVAQLVTDELAVWSDVPFSNVRFTHNHF